MTLVALGTRPPEGFYEDSPLAYKCLVITSSTVLSYLSEHTRVAFALACRTFQEITRGFMPDSSSPPPSPSTTLTQAYCLHFSQNPRTDRIKAKVVDRLLKMGVPFQALDLAYGILDRRKQILALYGVFQYFTQTRDETEAERVAKALIASAYEIPEVSVRAEVLFTVFSDCLKKDPYRAASLASVFPDQIIRNQALLHVAFHLFMVLGPEEAMPVVRLTSIKDEPLYARCLDLLEADDIEQAIRLAETIANSAFKNHTRVVIVFYLNNAGNFARATQVADMIPKDTRQNTTFYHLALRMISISLAKNGHMEHALDAITQISTRSTRDEVLQECCLHLLQNENIPLAIQISGRIENSDMRSLVLRDSILALRRANNFVEESLLLPSITSEEDRSILLEDDCHRLLVTGNVEEAQDVALSIPQAQIRSRVLQKIATRRA